jgi:hypothetical protein
MASLPEDLERWIEAHFPAAEVNIARELLTSAIDHAGAAPGARLLRCAAVGSRGDLVQLRYLVGLLQIELPRRHHVRRVRRHRRQADPRAKPERAAFITMEACRRS